MTITISAQLEAQIKEKATAEGLTVEAYIERLIREDGAWEESKEEPLHQNDSESDEIRIAVSEGLVQAQRGEGNPPAMYSPGFEIGMVFRVELTPRAQQDLEEIYDWVIRETPITGVRWFERFERSVLALSTFPERCIVEPKLSAGHQPIRKLVFGTNRYKYRVYFAVTGDLVSVVHIRHGSRKEPRRV